MKKYLSYIVFIGAGILVFTPGVRSQTVFTSLDSLLNYATVVNISLQSGGIRMEQSKQAKRAALLNIPDVSGGVNFSYTNNTRLPVSLFPAEVFGGQPGSFREVQTGVQYVTNLNQTLDIKLFNLKAWEYLKSARLNIEATALDNRITRKSLYEHIATIYFNIVTLQEQLLQARQNLLVADTLSAIANSKFNQGLLRRQDVNDVTVSQINTRETVSQIVYALQQQYLALKLLCDIPEDKAIAISHPEPSGSFDQEPVAVMNTLAIRSAGLTEQLAWSTYKAQKYSFYPSLSLFQAYTTQQFNSRGKFPDGTVNWIPSSYIGLRLSVPIPGASAVTQASKAKYDYLLAKKITEQVRIKAALEQEQLLVDYSKAVSQARSNAEVYRLRRDSYERNKNLFAEGLLAPDQVLNACTAMISAGYTWISSRINVQLAKARIDINNSIQ